MAKRSASIPDWLLNVSDALSPGVAATWRAIVTSGADLSMIGPQDVWLRDEFLRELDTYRRADPESPAAHRVFQRVMRAGEQLGLTPVARRKAMAASVAGKSKSDPIDDALGLGDEE